MQHTNFTTPKPKGVILYPEQGEVIGELTDRQAGQLIKAVFGYWAGREVKLDKTLKLVFIPIKNRLERDIEKYGLVVEKNRRNINTRWEKEKKLKLKNIPSNTTVYDRIPLDTKNTNININTNTNSLASNAGIGKPETENPVSLLETYFNKIAPPIFKELGISDPKVKNAARRAYTSKGKQQSELAVRRFIEKQAELTPPDGDYIDFTTDWPEKGKNMIEDDVNDVLSEIESTKDSSPEDFGELLEASMDSVFDQGRVVGVTTGYRTLDQKTNGLKKSHLYLLAAETGMGKSVFAINLIINLIAHTDQTASYLDLENGRDASFARFLMIKGLKSPDFFKDQNNKQDAVEIAQSFKGRLLYRDHTKLASLFPECQGDGLAWEISKLIRRDVKDKAVRIVVIDPLENFELGRDDFNSIAKVVILFKNLAQELGISIIILHHLRKPDGRSQKVTNLTEAAPATYRIPTLSDVLGTSKITNIATDVWALVRQKDSPSQEEAGRTLLRILKQREGSILGDVHLVMNTQNLRFAELAPVDDEYEAAKHIFYPYKEET